MFVLRGGTVVDADGARRADVAVDDGEVVAVESDVDVDADREVDTTGRYVTTGLIDAHVHLGLDGRADLTSLAGDSESMLAYRAANALRGAVAAGVTTVRELGAPGTLAVDARDAVDAGLIPGPCVVPAGNNIVMTGGHGHWLGGREVDGVPEARKAAREQLKKGAEVLKVMATGGVLSEGTQTGAPELFDDELRAVVEVAESAGVPVAAHAHGTAGIKNAVRAGVDSVEHGTFMDREAASMMADRGTYWVPTTKALAGIAEAGADAGIPEHAVLKTETAEADHAAAFDLALDAGVPIAMGTDAGTPFNHHADAAEGLELLVDRGLSPEAALGAATANAADLLGLDDVGRVAEGYRADLLVLDADPSANAGAWGDPAMVIADGDVVVADGEVVVADGDVIGADSDVFVAEDDVVVEKSTESGRDEGQ